MLKVMLYYSQLKAILKKNKKQNKQKQRQQRQNKTRKKIETSAIVRGLPKKQKNVSNTDLNHG